MFTSNKVLALDYNVISIINALGTVLGRGKNLRNSEIEKKIAKNSGKNFKTVHLGLK